MERLNDEGQWIVLMGFIISTGIFFLAIIINQSVMVGQTTSEAILEFPKSEIQDISDEIVNITRSKTNVPGKMEALKTIAMNRENAIVWETTFPDKYSDSYYKYTEIEIHYNNGVTAYYEKYLLPVKI
ncbi:MAG: hypothetical protein PHP13_05705 [Methanomicrobium sp.]|nr:hypothetical protein [Methanomicrobium sp.]